MKAKQVGLMGGVVKKNIVFLAALFIIAYIMLPFSILPAGGSPYYGGARNGSSLSLADALRNLSVLKGNAYSICAESARPQEGPGARKAPEAKKIPFAALLIGLSYGLPVRINGNRLAGTFRKRKFNRHIIIPYGALAPPRAYPALT